MSDRWKCTEKHTISTKNALQTHSTEQKYSGPDGRAVHAEILSPLLFEVYSVCHLCLIIYVSNMGRRFLPVLLTPMCWHWCVAGPGWAAMVVDNFVKSNQLGSLLITQTLCILISLRSNHFKGQRSM